MKSDALKNANDNIEAVGLLVAALDARWEDLSSNSACGFWHEEGATVPDDVVLWTNFHHQSDNAEVEAYLVDGDYGIFTSTDDFNVPAPNSGGRYLILSGEANVTDPEGCLLQAQLNSIVNASDSGVAFDRFYEDTGYAWGKALKKGDSVDAGLFHGHLTSDGDVDLGTNLWFLESSRTTDQGGRWMPVCQGVSAN
jgi:hypothetical protein